MVSIWPCFPSHQSECAFTFGLSVCHGVSTRVCLPWSVPPVSHCAVSHCTVSPTCLAERSGPLLMQVQCCSTLSLQVERQRRLERIKQKQSQLQELILQVELPITRPSRPARLRPPGMDTAGDIVTRWLSLWQQVLAILPH